MRRASPSPAEEVRDLSVRLRHAEDPFTFARLAELLHQQGRLVEARSLCEQALARYPGYVRAHAVMAQVAESEGDLERAEAELRMVLRGEPQNRVCRVALGRLLVDRGALAEAKQHLEYALFLSPGDTVARGLLAQASVPPAAPRGGSMTVAARPAASAGSPLEQALGLVAEAEGVVGVLLVDQSGLLIDSSGTAA